MSLPLLFNKKSSGQKSLDAFIRAHAGSYDALILDQDGTILNNMPLIAWIDSKLIDSMLREISCDKNPVFACQSDLLDPEIYCQGFEKKVEGILKRNNMGSEKLETPLPGVTRLQICEETREQVTRAIFEYLAISQKDSSIAPRIFPGVEDFLLRHRAAGTPMAVGSSNEQTKLEAMLHASGLARIFTPAQGTLHAYGGACFIGPDGRETRRPVKPAPDIFLHAARQLGAAPERCIVVGDGDADMIAASRAGMLGIGITPEIATLPEYHEKAAFLMDNGAAIVVPSWFALDRIVSPLLGKAPLDARPAPP